MTKPISIAEARSTVGNWLALCRTDPAAAALSRPDNLTDAYSVANLSREIDTKKGRAMTEAARKKARTTAARIQHNPAARLAVFDHSLIPEGGKLVIKRVGTGKRRNTLAFLELPHPSGFPLFVVRYKAGRRGIFHAVAFTKRGHGHSLPPNAPKPHPWLPLSPKLLPNLHPAARSFIALLSP